MLEWTNPLGVNVPAWRVLVTNLIEEKQKLRCIRHDPVN